MLVFTIAKLCPNYKKTSEACYSSDIKRYFNNLTYNFYECNSFEKSFQEKILDIVNRALIIIRQWKDSLSKLNWI